jgi:hypothetical protein
MKKHLKLVDASNSNPLNLTYDQVEDKIHCMMDVLDLVQTLNLEDEFPHLEKQIKQYIELQNTLALNPPPPPEVEMVPDNVVDLSLVFAFRKFQNEKRQQQAAKPALPPNVVELYPKQDNDEDIDVG